MITIIINTQIKNVYANIAHNADFKLTSKLKHHEQVT